MSPNMADSRAAWPTSTMLTTSRAMIDEYEYASNDNETALQRLAADLCVAVPSMALLALLFTIGTIHVAVKGFATTDVRSREFVSPLFVPASVRRADS